MDAEQVYGALNSKIKNIQVSGGGVSAYKDLSGKPQINGVTLQGNLDTNGIGITIPEELPNPYPINFDGMLLRQTYNGSQEVTVVFPDVEILNETAGTPVGEIISYMGVTAPPNYLVCDGTVYQIADYPYLAQHFQDNFGSVNFFGGNGTTTFAVPDLRGEFLRGTGTSKYNSGTGDNVGIHQNPTYHIEAATGASFVNFSKTTGVSNADKKIQRAGTASITGTSNNNTNYGNYTSRPTNTSVLWCIKYKPTYFVTVGHTYSYEQRRVGTWVDGKPLYEKTVYFGSLPNVGDNLVPHNIENVDTILICGGCIIRSGVYYDVSVSTEWFAFATKTAVGIWTKSGMPSDSAIVTIRYTKTTD